MSRKNAVLPQTRELLIVTGLSGAGKSTALRALEDLNHFTVDSLPVSLVPEMEAIMEHASMAHYRGMAIGMDLRQDNFPEQIIEIMKNLDNAGVKSRLIFLEAAPDALMRRYASTRRPHPLEKNGLALARAIAEERERLQSVRANADLVIDTTNFSIHDLRRLLQHHLSESDRLNGAGINIISFGYKYGLPADADLVFDLRYLKNPYFVEQLKTLSGLDAPVSEYIFNDASALETKDRILSLLLFTLEKMLQEGRQRITIAFGCTGGRHRSVAMAESVAQALKDKNFKVVVEHRHIERDAAAER